MNKSKQHRLLPLVFLGLISTQVVFAGSVSMSEMADTCHAVSQEIFDLSSGSYHHNFQQEKGIRCSYETSFAGAHLRTAGKNLLDGDVEQAVIHMLSSERNLRFIQSHPRECPGFAPYLKPYIATVANLKKEMAEIID